MGGVSWGLFARVGAPLAELERPVVASRFHSLSAKSKQVPGRSGWLTQAERFFFYRRYRGSSSSAFPGLPPGEHRYLWPRFEVFFPDLPGAPCFFWSHYLFFFFFFFFGQLLLIRLDEDPGDTEVGGHRPTPIGYPSCPVGPVCLVPW